MFASIKSACITGTIGNVIRVEVHSSSGFPGYSVVGMPDTAMRESKERIRAAMISSGLKWPQSRLTINLAPASIRKTGTGSELAILVGLLCTLQILEVGRFNDAGVIGELGLDGTIRAINGTLARILVLREYGIKQFFVPYANAAEASLVPDIEVFPIKTVNGLVKCLTEGEPWPDIPTAIEPKTNKTFGDYSEIIGQSMGCEAMMLLAAGGHHSFLLGSPGVGKTMLAERLPSILPELSEEQSFETSAITSVISGGVHQLQTTKPFIQPHHSASSTAIIGGGSSFAVPGEITHAHNGVLFLDELSEFARNTLDMLRQPLETGTITVSRAKFHSLLPANFSLLACSNPCPCAKPIDNCICSDTVRQKYLQKLSGPLLDRFDIRLELFRSPYTSKPTHSSSAMLEQVLLAAQRQSVRNEIVGGKLNSKLTSKEIRKVAPLSETVRKLFSERVEKREISGRGAVAIWRVALTLSDLDDHSEISEIHMSRAFDFREEIS